jgi:hypothetical protein
MPLSGPPAGSGSAAALQVQVGTQPEQYRRPVGPLPVPQSLGRAGRTGRAAAAAALSGDGQGPRIFPRRTGSASAVSITVTDPRLGPTCSESDPAPGGPARPGVPEDSSTRLGAPVGGWQVRPGASCLVRRASARWVFCLWGSCLSVKLVTLRFHWHTSMPPTPIEHSSGVPITLLVTPEFDLEATKTPGTKSKAANAGFHVFAAFRGAWSARPWRR